MTTNKYYDPILASLALAGIGDALGAPTELWGIDEIFARYDGLADRFEEPTPDTFAGANSGKRGEVTDDASQMYYLARALVKAGGRLDQAGWIACLLDWAETSPKAGFMGPTTAAIVAALQAGEGLDRVGVVGTSKRKLTTMGNTNGAAMRVAPAGLVHPGNIAAACEQALVTCLPSHDTDVAIASACAIAAGAAMALVERDIDAVVQACRKGGLIGARLAVEHARVPPGPRFSTRLDMALEIATRATDDRQFLYDLDAAIGASMLACESVPAAIAIFAYAKGDPLRTVALAASVGNDTDTVATMAGAMAGAMAGTAKLPQTFYREFVAVNDAEFHLQNLAAGLADIALENSSDG
ncbi:ADP-ribosylglycohydrolase family protein [Rhizobium lusitanum]|uniref:ADP-ribosylglycohydrolase family protein n=1 Tax=Rhizobium lusitanum TaxID=293958 RepID=UPI00195C6BD5|nr:ADP-ribosylglycohydrolase family protein [Rhizobium lusitanum]MBM7045776.1 ADP-ribosylglycohydrolase family protein [Rhizobium lusitanum]